MSEPRDGCSSFGGQDGMFAGSPIGSRSILSAANRGGLSQTTAAYQVRTSHDLSSRGAQTWSEECRGSMKSAPSLRTPAACSLPCNKGPSVAPPSPHRLSPTCTAPSPRRLRSGGDSAAAREKGAAIDLSPSPPRRTAAELGRGRCPIALPQPAERCKADETALLQRKVVSV